MLRTPVSEVCPKTRVFGHTSDTGVTGYFRSRHEYTENKRNGTTEAHRCTQIFDGNGGAGTTGSGSCIARGP
jgi:hypothetical protein